MHLRTRIALLVGVTVLIASAIGGLGTSLGSMTLGRDRLDQALLDDATNTAANRVRLANQLQFTFEARRQACDQPINRGAGTSTGASDRRPSSTNRLRFLPEFASTMQLIRPNGTSVAACESLPVDSDDLALARAGVGSRFRTVSIDGSRVRVLTQGYGDIGAVQFARSLEITDDTLRALILRSAIFGAVGAVFASLLGWVFARRATDPVHRLSAAAERVAQTRDLGERIDVAGDTEIQTLALSFNTMLASLDTSREQQRRLVQDASHELRTPLTSIKTNVELLLRHGDIDDATRSQMLVDISDELNELGELTAELVESATEIPSTIPLSADVDLGDVVMVCVERARRRHRRAVEVQIDEEPSRLVTGDAALLERAVTNLLNNAAKFSTGVSPIEVRVTGGAVGVSDRGPGIAEHDLPLIFDRFYRSTQARSAPGSGLGLSIVKQIVEGHSGSTSAANRDGGGATIGFVLPTAAPTTPPPPQ